MKAKLQFTILFLFVSIGVFSQSLLPPTVYVQLVVEDWCNGQTGKLDAQVFGGTPPYTYQWSMGVSTEIASGLSAGQYDVTVTDNLGMVANGSGIVGTLSAPEFYVISIEMPRQGMSNGSVTVSIYPDNGGGATYLPDGIYNYNLFDSTGTLIQNYTFNVPGSIYPYYTFTNLPKGNYNVQCTIGGLGCFTYNNFHLKEMPSLNPSFNSLPSCNGAPTGQLVVNSHPYPPIDANTFTSNQVSNLFVMEVVTSKYKAIVYDSNNVAQSYFRTQDSIFTMNGLLPGNYTLKIYGGDTIDSFNPGSHDSVLVYSGSFTIANDTLCSLVKGRLFADYNNNCSYNAGDIALSGTLIELNPGSLSAITNSSGEFYIPVPVGYYTLKQYAPYQYAQLCPDTNTFSINVSSSGLIIDVQLADSINVNPDVQVGLYVSQPRPGFNQYITITYRNLTPNIIPAQTLNLTYDTSLTYVNSLPVYITSSPGQLTWNTPALGPFGYAYFHATLNVPVSTALGTVLNTSATVSNVAGESNIANNTDSVWQTVTGSYDPNEKEVSPAGYDSAGYISGLQNLKYTIRFQNTGTDTAFTVVVADTLPPALNRYSLKVLGASNDYWYEFKNQNIVLFHFDNILLPDSNVNEEASHGYIKFSIEQMPGNLAGTIIENNAGIYFDFNAPVITNTVKNTIFDCSQMATATLSNQTICEGDSITGSSTLLFNMNETWYLDSVFYSNNSPVTISNLTSGVHEIKYVASNSACSQQIISNIMVNALPPQPIVTESNFTVSSSSSFGNQWLLDGTLISGATDSFYVATISGWYSVIVTDANGCSIISDSIYVLVEGIADLENINRIKIIPNPATTDFEISGLKLERGNEIMITNSIGKVYSQTKLDESTLNHKINVSNLPNGLYFVNIKTANKSYVSKLLKMQ